MKENKKLYKILKVTIGPVIFVGNHKHAIDAIVVIINTDRIVHYIAKESMVQ